MTSDHQLAAWAIRSVQAMLKRCMKVVAAEMEATACELDAEARRLAAASEGLRRAAE